MKKYDFRNKKVLITGASGGIGMALAVEFAKRGAHLVMNSLPSEKSALEKLSGSLKDEYGINTWMLPTDLNDESGPDILYEETIREVGDIYALVCNAGLAAYGKIWELEWEKQLSIIRVNLIATLKLMRLFVRDMVERDEGVVFVTSSVAAFQPTVFHSVYGGCKAAIQSISQGMRMELKDTNVSVCTLNPPHIDTPLLRIEGFPKRVRWYSMAGPKSPEWVAKRAIRAFERGKFMYVPGIFAKFMHLFIPRILPRRLTDLISYYALQQSRGSGTY